MEILLGARELNRDFRSLLSDPKSVEKLLREIDDPWVGWVDFSAAIRFNDDPLVAEILGQRDDVVIWKLQTTDGVEAYVFISLETERSVIRVEYKLEESEDATLWRSFRGYLDSKLANMGISMSGVRSREEYLAVLDKKIGDQTEEPRSSP